MIPLKDNIPSMRKPYVMIGILVLNILVFLYELSLGSDVNRFFLTFGAIPCEIVFYTNFFALFTIFSSMFIHGSFEHIIGNMLYLWIFGNNVEDAFGHGKFFLFYLICGFFGSGLQILIHPTSKIPLIGASGAISGILGAYLVLYPRARVLALIPFLFFLRLVYLPAVLFLLFWIFVQALQGISSLGDVGYVRGGVAWFAHIGGFITGVILALPIRRRIKKTYEYGDWEEY